MPPDLIYETALLEVSRWQRLAAEEIVRCMSQQSNDNDTNEQAAVRVVMAADLQS